MKRTSLNNVKLGIVATALVFVGACSDRESAQPSSPSQPSSPTSIAFDRDKAFTEYLTALVDTSIIPGYETLLKKSTQMRDSAVSSCESGGNIDSQQYQKLTNDFSQLIGAWQAIQWVKVGAIIDDNRLFRFQFFPDPNRAVERGVSILLAKESTITEKDVAQVNVGGQGIPALEFVLYLERADDKNALSEKECEIVEAISQNLVNISSEVLASWQTEQGNYRNQVITGTGDFTGATDSVEELVTNWFESLERVKDEKVIYPLGVRSPGNIRVAEFSLSDNNLASIERNIETYIDIYTNGDAKGLDDILKDDLKLVNTAERILATLKKMRATIQTIRKDHGNLRTALADEQGRAQLNQLTDDFRDFRAAMSEDMLPALDLSIGFNFVDGD